MRVIWDQSQHFLANRTTYFDLVQSAQNPASKLHQIQLNFLTPTVFNSNKLSFPFPLSRLVFGGLETKWRELDVGPHIPHAFNAFLEYCVEVTDYELSTNKLILPKNAIAQHI